LLGVGLNGWLVSRAARRRAEQEAREAAEQRSHDREERRYADRLDAFAAFDAAVTERRLSPGSVRRLHALLRRSLTVAVRWQLIPWNPVATVDPPSLTVTDVHPNSAAEAKQFLAAVAGDRFEARWRLALTLGLRQGEVLGLAWRDVDLDQRVVLVRQTLQYRPGEGLHLDRRSRLGDSNPGPTHYES
jgi:integrase